MKVKLKKKPQCCGQDMDYDDCNQSLIHSFNAELQSWTCRGCGYFITIVEDVLDEGELEDYLENHQND